MDLNIEMALPRFKQLLPDDRNLVMTRDDSLLTREQFIHVIYDLPNCQSFNEKANDVLMRFGWKKEYLELTAKTVYIKFTRDAIIPIETQAKQLKEEAEKQAGNRDITF